MAAARSIGRTPAAVTTRPRLAGRGAGAAATAVLAGLLLLPASPGPARAYGGDDAQPPPARTWTVRNECDEPVAVAVHYQELDGRVVTRGWWRLEAGREAAVRMRSEWIGYFAFSRSGRFWWDPEGPVFGVAFSRHFVFAGTGAREARQRYGFHWISVIAEPVTRLVCP